MLRWILLAAVVANAPANESIAGDEEVFIPPVAASPAADGGWTLHLAARVQEPERDSVKRNVLLSAVRAALAIEDIADADERARFTTLARPFLADDESGKRPQIRLAGRVWPLSVTGGDGWADADLALTADDAALLATDDAATAVLAAGDDRTFAGRVALVADGGEALIVDLDDTCKISEVRNKRRLLTNTFLRPWQPVSGMAAWLTTLAAGRPVHVVSASPWELYAPLAAWWRESGFPTAHWHLRRAGLGNLSAPPERHKQPVITGLLARWPTTRFILVGDSGERDPEIYAGIAREHPGRVVRIVIRDVTGEGPEAARWQATFAGLPAGMWTIGLPPTSTPLP